MTRIDRKTGEPILSPKLTVDQLYAMANEPGWRPWMRLIAEHPHAWPELAEWWRTAQEQGFDTAGAAPEPPESMRGRRRVAIPAAPLPPENGAEPEAADPVGSTDGWESVPLASEEGLAADPAPSPPEPEEDAGRQSPDPDRREEPEPETMREALDDADDDFAALEQVADTEPSTMDIPPLPEPAETEPPMDDGTDTDPFADVRVRRAIPWKAIGITVALILVLIGITVQDIVEGTEVLYLHTRVAVLVELAVFYDIVVGILCAVLYVCGRAAGRFVALYKETVVACVCYIHMVEVPVRGCQSDALIRVVAMFMIWMVAIDYGSSVKTYERVVVVCRAVAVVDIYSCCRSVFSRCEINRCAWFHRLVDGKLYTCKRRFCRQSVVSITTCR